MFIWLIADSLWCCFKVVFGIFNLCRGLGVASVWALDLCYCWVIVFALLVCCLGVFSGVLVCEVCSFTGCMM